ncbi:MAG TPA: DUF2189 domain-containing protein [Stellaceae bacterium]|nr:DUF2189 domain-containing protein [Stellaceae bacterium]
MATTIRNPIEWGYDQLRHAANAVEVTGRAVRGRPDAVATAPAVRRIEIADLKDALAKGISDFGEARSDVIFLCLLYPVAGLVIARIVFGSGMFALLFPLVSGFALLGPFVAVGLYEMSRQREEGHELSWATAFDVVRSPSFGAIITLGIVLMALFLLWMSAAEAIYTMTVAPLQPTSMTSFVTDVFTTARGWAMIGIGIGVGFIFALVVFAISVVSFPMLIDRDVGLGVAVWTSLRAIIANPIPMAAWGLIVTAGLVLGSIPLLLGLMIVLPILGHASWHLYRKVVER